MAAELLLIGPDGTAADTLRLHLAQAGVQSSVAVDAAAAWAAVAARGWDAVLLDLSLPEGRGLDLCRDFRRRFPALPLIALGAASAAGGAAGQCVLGLELGADDVVPRPLSMPELVARVRALLRRTRHGLIADEAARDWRFGRCRLEVAHRMLHRNGRSLPLTLREFDLLVCLLRHPGQTRTRHELLGQVWGARFVGGAHTVDSHVHRLRAKVEDDPRRPRHLVTVRGVGYRFDDPEDGPGGAVAC